MSVPNTKEATLAAIISEGFELPAIWSPEAKIIHAFNVLHAEDDLDPLPTPRLEVLAGCAIQIAANDWYDFGTHAGAVLVAINPRLT